MTKLCMIAIGFCLAGLVSPSNAVAAKADGKKAKLIAKYDKNANGVLDGDEKDALRKDYTAKKDGELKQYDTNSNGKLDDDEIAAIKPGAGKKAKQEDLIAKYDKNGNGVLDGDEKEALRKDYTANKDGDLKKYDTNTDGKLDDKEIAAIKPGPSKKKKDKAK